MQSLLQRKLELEVRSQDLKPSSLSHLVMKSNSLFLTKAHLKFSKAYQGASSVAAVAENEQRMAVVVLTERACYWLRVRTRALHTLSNTLVMVENLLS